MDGDKVIIDRARLEQLERESDLLRTGSEVLRVTHEYPLWSSPSIQYEYEGKDERIKKIVGTANEKDNEVKEVRKERDELADRINNAPFLARLKYLFTKEI